MSYSVFTELSLIIALGAGIALIMRAIKQPLIIGHILTGILVGPSVFHFVQTPETIETFSSIGIALLLFIIGLSLNPGVIKEVGKVSAITGILQVGASTLLGWSLGTLVGLGQTEAIFLGVALSFSSTIIILKLLSDKKEQTRLYGKVAIGLLIVQDVLATVALLFVTSNGSGQSFSFTQLATLFAKGTLIAIPILLAGNLLLPRWQKFIAGSHEVLFLFALGWGFGTAALFEISGFSLEVGALLAGVSLARLPYTQEISARLRPLRDFFVIVFFISLGTRLDFGGIKTMVPVLLVSCITVIIFKPLIVMVIMGIMGYTKRTSFKAAITMAQLSEFSLIFVILGNNKGFVSDEFVSLITLVALISIAASAYLISYSDKLYLLFENHLSMFERHKTHFEQSAGQARNDMVLFGYQKGGHEFLKVFKTLGKRYVVIDYDPEVIDVLEHQKVNYLYGDAFDIELLEEAGIDKARMVVSTIGDSETNLFLVKLLDKINKRCVVICHADTVDEAEVLYNAGASYVMMPHYIGSEKIGAFIRKNGFNKSEFRKYREKHLAYLESHYNLEPHKAAATVSNA
jgi:Kef-type K+ transport system membrane component KefB